MNHTNKRTARGLRAAAVLAMCATMFSTSIAQQTPLVGYEDIDLFSNPPAATDLPNVLLMLDTSANWSANTSATVCSTYDDGTPGPVETSSKAGIEKCALVNALLSLPVNTDGSAMFRVGLMYFNAPNADGGYPRLRFLELTTANKTILIDAIKGTLASSQADQASNADISRGLWEAGLWYRAQAPWNGRAQTNASRIRYDSLAFDGSGNYISPSAANCARNYVIVMANGVGQSTESDVGPKITAAGGDASVIRYASGYMNNSAENNLADETSRYLNKNLDASSQTGSQNVTTFSIAVTSASPSTAETRGYHYVEQVAVQGGGQYFSAQTVSELTDAIKKVFNAIQAGNSVFASPSLPASVNSQGTYLNQVFMGMFRPDEQGRPRWVGNLKQYKFAYNSSSQQVTLVDAVGSAVVNPITGFVMPNAQSIWTSNTPYNDFWKNKTWANEPNVGGASDWPDGQLVEKGGVAQKLRSAYVSSRSARTIYTCTTCSNSLTAFDTTLSPSVFGLSATTDRDTLVNWVRGDDNKGDEFGPGTVTPTAGGSAVTATVRPTIHGDVVHSSPAVINYGGSTGSVAFYGANDGLFRAVNANVSGTSAGMEMWAFIPQEMLPRLSRLRNNDPIIKFASTNTTAFPTAARREWGVDGPVTFYQKLSSPTRAIVYFGLRRGGNALYAIDVTSPSSPSLLWRFTDADLGQTWSEPRVTRLAGYTNPVIIMGGGYDAAAEDLGAAQTMGNKVYIIDAITGDLVQKFGGIDRSVPGGVALYDSDGDGRTDRLYAGDLGGNLYRIDLGGSVPNAWGPTKKIAALGDAAGAKIFYAPEVTQAGPYVAIQFGTGDREKPLQSSGTNNRFFTVYDKGQNTAIDLSNLTSMTVAGLSAVPADSYGCYLTLPNAGEKVVSGVTYGTGYSFFGTNGPPPSSATSCTGSMGVARSYAVSAFCGPALINTLVGGGFPPTPKIATVLIPPSSNSSADCATNPAACSRVPVCIGCPPPDCNGNASVVKSGIDSTNVYACAPNQRQRRGVSIKNPR